MDYILLAIFVIGYVGIVLEHNIKIDKAASALLTGTVLWGLFVTGYTEVPTHLVDLFSSFSHDGHASLSGFYEHRLLHHMQEISSILFFLLGAMTIVELVDAHEGFRVITDRINTNSKVKLMWIICILTFFFSAVLDNLTTSIVMISLLRKLIDDKETRWLFAGMVVVAANAGGAWSPIGDVTTTMLWIGGQLSTSVIVVNLILPSIVALIVPLLILSVRLKGTVTRPVFVDDHRHDPTSNFERNLVFTVGVCGLLFVPVFKTVTHLPPFMGMMLSLGVIWL
ncbi:MAG: sodium:proton antiporter NhaD, partial [Flavobacteriales bacterium]|nr:sodium:proton antiporter NhaD [Flavobacteriales bacterium]